jgi:hypothetical protein
VHLKKPQAPIFSPGKRIPIQERDVHCDIKYNSLRTKSLAEALLDYWNSFNERNPGNKVKNQGVKEKDSHSRNIFDLETALDFFSGTGFVSKMNILFFAQLKSRLGHSDIYSSK